MSGRKVDIGHFNALHRASIGGSATGTGSSPGDPTVLVPRGVGRSVREEPLDATGGSAGPFRTDEHIDTDDDFEAWVAPHLEVMRYLALRLAGADEADDAVQDALTRAWRHRDDLRPGQGVAESVAAADRRERGATWLAALEPSPARTRLGCRGRRVGRLLDTWRRPGPGHRRRRWGGEPNRRRAGDRGLAPTAAAGGRPALLRGPPGRGLRHGHGLRARDGQVAAPRGTRAPSPGARRRASRPGRRGRAGRGALDPRS